MKTGQIWFKRRQDWKKSRFFSIKKSSKSGFNVVMMATGSLWESSYFNNNEAKGFENNNQLLTENEIVKYVLSGDLNPVIF